MTMKTLHYYFLFLSLFTISINTTAQSNQWTWMNGTNLDNHSGSYGTKGVASATNSPPALYQPYNWTDQQGNFWLFGGMRIGAGYPWYNALWKFDPTINQWTWMSGPSASGQAGTYGTKGVSAANNIPGCRMGGCSWVDKTGNYLWLFGGQSPYSGANSRTQNDLWRYEIATNEWTWMSGANVPNQAGIYGTMGVANATNVPGARGETNAAWVDNQGNLWFFGGADVANYAYNTFSDLWKYDIGTNQWTWVKGDNSVKQVSRFGTKGVSAVNNNPAGMYHAAWKDGNDNFYMFGGTQSMNSPGGLNTIWKYTLTTNEWTWIQGTTVEKDLGNNNGKCNASTTNNPPGRSFNKANWIDNCGNLWTFGGAYGNGSRGYNDLWKYSITNLDWTWISGSITLDAPAVYGTKGIPSSTYTPGYRMGAVSWVDKNGSLWLFGGTSGYNSYNDMWKFNSKPFIGSSYTVSVNSGCAPLAVDFTGSAISNCGGEIKSYEYNYGDPSSGINNTAIGASTSHTFNVAGTYTVQLIATSCNGGKDTAVKVITVNSCGPLKAEVNGGVICSGDCMDLVATTTGGTPNYTYSWSHSIGTAVGPHSVCPTATTVYTLTVTDSDGTTLTDTAEVIVSPIIEIITSVSNATCNEANGALSITVSGGIPSYTYLWSNGATDETASYLAAGNYTISVKDAIGCTQTAIINITSSSGGTVSVTINTDIKCNGDKNGVATGTMIGGASPYTYNWSNGSNNQIANNLSAGTYTLTIQDVNGCTDAQTITLVEPLAISLETSSQSDTCSKGKGMASVTASGGSGNYVYLWTNNQTTTNITGLLSGTYSVVVTDSDGCTKTLAIAIANENVTTVDAGIDVTINQGDSTTLNGIATPSNIIYSWKPSSGLTDSTISNPKASPDATTIYTLTVTDSNGCSQSDIVTVEVIITCDETEVFIPNSFSPNNDNHNDVLYVRNNCIQAISFIVYNRWGEKMFESTDITKGWDGTYNGKDVGAGVYVYSIEAILISNETYTNKGHVNLIR